MDYIATICPIIENITQRILIEFEFRIIKWYDWCTNMPPSLWIDPNILYHKLQCVSIKPYSIDFYQTPCWQSYFSSGKRSFHTWWWWWLFSWDDGEIYFVETAFFTGCTLSDMHVRHACKDFVCMLRSKSRLIVVSLFKSRLSLDSFQPNLSVSFFLVILY